MGERGEISRRARFLAGQVCVPRVRVPRCGPSDHDRRGLPARLKSQPHFKSPSATSSRSLSPTHAMPPAAGPAPSSDDNGSEQPASCLTCKRTSGGIVAAAGIWGLAQVRRNAASTKPNQTSLMLTLSLALSRSLGRRSRACRRNSTRALIADPSAGCAFSVRASCSLACGMAL